MKVDAGSCFRPTADPCNKVHHTVTSVPDAVVEGARKTAAALFEIGKDTISSLRAQRLETVFEEALVVHSGPLLVTVILAEGLPFCRLGVSYYPLGNLRSSRRAPAW